MRVDVSSSDRDKAEWDLIAPFAVGLALGWPFRNKLWPRGQFA